VTDGQTEQQAVEEEWRAALEHAGLDHTEFRLFVLEGERPEDAAHAAYYNPGLAIVGTGALSEAQEDWINESVDHHRVSVWKEGVDHPVGRALLAAKIRHELEHAVQWMEGGDGVFKLSDLGDHVLREKLGDTPKGAAYYQLKPTENDANAAASMYVRDRYPEHVPSLLAMDEGIALVRSTVPPEPRDTLVARSVAFLFLFRNETEAVLPAPPTVDSWLDSLCDGAGSVWNALEGRLP
jgi:hypothetical protein